MFLGHFGVAFGTKTRQASVSLGTLFLATQFADLLWPTLLLFGAEEVTTQLGQMVSFKFVSYLITHSLLLDILWASGWASAVKLRDVHAGAYHILVAGQLFEGRAGWRLTTPG